MAGQMSEKCHGWGCGDLDREKRSLPLHTPVHGIECISFLYILCFVERKERMTLSNAFSAYIYTSKKHGIYQFQATFSSITPWRMSHLMTRPATKADERSLNYAFELIRTDSNPILTRFFIFNVLVTLKCWMRVSPIIYRDESGLGWRPWCTIHLSNSFLRASSTRHF